MSIVWYVLSARRIGATRAQVLLSTAPLWGILGAILVLREPWTWPLAIAVLLVVLAVGSLGRERGPTGYQAESGHLS